MITQLRQIVEEARLRGRCRLAVAYGNDEHTLSAVAEAWKAGLVNPTVYGDKALIEQTCRSLGLPDGAVEAIECSSDTECVRRAVAGVAAGEFDILMKGLVSTDKYMRGILNKDAGLVPPKATLSHVSVVEIPGMNRLLCIGDVAVIPAPDFKQKTVIIGYLASTARSLGIEFPKVACIAPSEQLLPSVPSSVEGAVLSKMADRGQLGNIIADGPLSLDVPLYPEVAEGKHVKGSAVAGKADCLLFPNIESGNVFFKSATHMGGAEVAALVAGAKAPCVLTSRGDTPATKLYSIALACLQVKH